MPDGLPFSPFEVRDDSNPSGDGLSHLNGAKLGGAATRWAFRMLLHVVLQGIAILCRVFLFGVEEANGFHYLSEVVRARRPRWSATLSSRHQVIALALLSLWFGGLCIVLLLVLAWLIVVLSSHRLLLTGIPIGRVEEVFY